MPQVSLHISFVIHECTTVNVEFVCTLSFRICTKALNRHIKKKNTKVEATTYKVEAFMS